jgi:hypothetical protein
MWMYLLLGCTIGGLWDKDTSAAPDTDGADTDGVDMGAGATAPGSGGSGGSDGSTDGTDDGTDGTVGGTDGTDAVAAPRHGDLVITEIMRRPGAVPGPDGAWFEVTNVAATPLALDGLRVETDGGAGFVVGAGPALPPGARRVFGGSPDSARNGGVPVDQAYDPATFVLGDAAGTLSLSAGSVVVDRVRYDDATFPNGRGQSMSLDPAAVDATLNDRGTAWCAGATVFGSGDRGTPGAPNDLCDAVTHDIDGDGTPDGTDCGPTDPGTHPGAVESENGRDDDCDGLVDEHAPAVGELVITEIMANPHAVADDEGEWFEITNVGAASVVLAGLSVTDEVDDSLSLATPDTLAPGGVYVLGASADTEANGGVTPDYVYDPDAFTLDNGGDTIVLSLAGATLDTVRYDADAVDTSGASLSLDPSAYSANGNDSAAAWCRGQDGYGPDNAGSPGKVNPPCN